MTEAAASARTCGKCGYAVPALLWKGDASGEHLILLTRGMAFEGVEHDFDVGVIRFTATENVRLALCRDVTPEATGLDRMRAAVETARNPQPPDRPVTLCGGPLRPGDTYYLAGDPTPRQVYAGKGPRGRHVAKWSAVPWWKRVLEWLFAS